MAINDNVKALTDEHGCIKDGQLASYVRCSMENKNLLQNKYDIYVGTGNYITDTSNESVSRETEGMNIINAVNAAATQLPDSATIKKYNPVKYARWGAENTRGDFDPMGTGEAELRIENGKYSEVKILGYNDNTDNETVITKYSFWGKKGVQSGVTLNVDKVETNKVETSIIQLNHYDTATGGGQISFNDNNILLNARTGSVVGNMTIQSDKITSTVPYVGQIGSNSGSGEKKNVYANNIECSYIKATNWFSGQLGTGVDRASIICTTISASGQIEAPSFNATSDARLKTNIKPFEYHNSILDVPVREYDWKESGEHAVGFVAQELQEVYPELVNENEDGILSIKETKLVYLLIEEVKKLKKEIEDLKKGG